MNRDDLISNIKLMLEKYPSTDGLNAAYSILKSSLVAPHLSEKILEIFTPMIADYLPFKDFLSFTQACRTTRNWKIRIMKERVNRLLKPYGNLEDFQHLMRNKGCLISGSSALWITEGQTTNWVPGDLDLYTPLGTAKDVIDFLRTKGFAQISTSFEMQNNTDYPDDAACIKSVTKLTRKNRKIDVIESAERLAIASIVHFHSTLVMNYLTADSLVLLYPKFTLERAWAPQCSVPQREDWGPRYKSRHYRMVPDEVGISARYHGLFCPNSYRTVGDRHCLFVPYDDKSDWGTQSLIEEPASDQMETDVVADREPFNWSFKLRDDETTGHEYCSQDICKLELYLANHPPSIVEYTARRTYCDIMNIISSKSRHQLETDEMFREAVQYTIRKIIEYSQLLVKHPIINIVRHYKCPSGCATNSR